MPKFAANLSLMFTEVAFLERFDVATRAGFDGVECQFPYVHHAEDIAARLRDNGLVQVLLNLPAGDWEAGDRGFACHPGRTDEFRASVDQALNYADRLGCTQVHALAGVAPVGVDVDTLRQTYVENLKYAADTLKVTGIRLLIEPINTYDMPGYYLTGTRQALDIIAATGSDNIALQYDLYHMHIMEGDLAATLQTHLPFIGHIQIADHPGRHEPGTGEIDYPSLFPHLDKIGYDGWVGCEYSPATTTQAGLGWADAYLKSKTINTSKAEI